MAREIVSYGEGYMSNDSWPSDQFIELLQSMGKVLSKMKTPPGEAATALTAGGHEKWADTPDAEPSIEGPTELYRHHATATKSTGETIPTNYPRHVGILFAIGVSLALVGFVATVILISVWPVVILLIGLVTIWLSSTLAHRAETRQRRSYHLQLRYFPPWTATTVSTN